MSQPGKIHTPGPAPPAAFLTSPGKTAPQQPNWAAAPQGYTHPSQVNLGGNAGASSGTNVGQGTRKAGAYGGSELGSRLGGAVGPPIIGGIVGSLAGEVVGEKVVKETGVDKKVKEAGDQLAGVIGRRQVNKLGEMTMSAFGYGDQETCICCPCLPASQVLLFLTVPFYVFNWYKLGIGVDYDRSCSVTANLSSEYTYNTTDNVTDVYPCEYGFHYLVASSAVWLCFLPFWITALFGNCWRQCCCCCCDPIVLCGTIIDFVKRCCCEVGNFNCCEFIWYSHCIFHIIWAGTGLVWLAGQPVGEPPLEVPGWQVPKEVWETVAASVVLDFIIAGSELVHRVKLHQDRKKSPPDEEEGVEGGAGVPLQQIQPQQIQPQSQGYH